MFNIVSRLTAAVSFAIGSTFFLLGCIVVGPKDTILVFQFGELIRVIDTPGLHFVIPFLQDTHTYDMRIQSLDMRPIEITLKDQKRIIVQLFARYKINDASRYYKAFREIENGQRARKSMIAIAEGALANELGQRKLEDLLSQTRNEIYTTLESVMRHSVESMGIEIIEVRPFNATLHPDNSHSVHKRMIAEQQRKANEYFGIGAEKSQTIFAETKTECEVMLANAEYSSQKSISEAQMNLISEYSNLRAKYGNDLVMLFLVRQSCSEFFANIESEDIAFFNNVDELYKSLSIKHITIN